MITGKLLEFAIDILINKHTKNRKNSGLPITFKAKSLEKSGAATQLIRPLICDIIKSIHLADLSHEY
jgi:hypothetical protein